MTMNTINLEKEKDLGSSCHSRHKWLTPWNPTHPKAAGEGWKGGEHPWPTGQKVVWVIEEDWLPVWDQVNLKLRNKLTTSLSVLVTSKESKKLFYGQLSLTRRCLQIINLSLIKDHSPQVISQPKKLKIDCILTTK